MRGKPGRRFYIVEERSRSTHGIPGTLHNSLRVLASSEKEACKVYCATARQFPTSVLRAKLEK